MNVYLQQESWCPCFEWDRRGIFSKLSLEERKLPFQIMSKAPKDLVKMWFSIHSPECARRSQERGSNILKDLESLQGLAHYLTKVSIRYPILVSYRRKPRAERRNKIHKRDFFYTGRGNYSLDRAISWNKILYSEVFSLL